MDEQPRAPVLGHVAGERVEELIEIPLRLGCARQPMHTLHDVPQRVRVEHEARPRHDVGPVARFVLLQQMEALVLLARQPDDRPLDVGATLRDSRAPGCCRSSSATAISHQSVASMQPRYQNSASSRPGSTNFGIWPLRA